MIYTFGKMRNNIINEKTARWSGMRNATDCGVGVHRLYEVIMFFFLFWLVLRNQSQVAWHIVLLCRRKHQPKKNSICWFSLFFFLFCGDSKRIDSMRRWICYWHFSISLRSTIVFMGNRHTVIPFIIAIDLRYLIRIGRASESETRRMGCVCAVCACASCMWCASIEEPNLRSCRRLIGHKKRND